MLEPDSFFPGDTRHVAKGSSLLPPKEAKWHRVGLNLTRVPGGRKGSVTGSWAVDLPRPSVSFCLQGAAFPPIF